MYMTIRKGAFAILIRCVVFLDIEGLHNNMFSNLKKIYICPVTFFTRRSNNIVEPHFSDRELFYYMLQINTMASLTALSNAVSCPGTVMKRCTAPLYSIRCIFPHILSARFNPCSRRISLSAAMSKVLGSIFNTSSLHRPTLMAEQRLSALMVYARLKAYMISASRPKPLP